MKSLEKNIEHIQLNKVSFDVNNPRGEREHQIVSDPEFQKLILSINTHGILEPLIVKKDLVKEGHYILIDGERRLRAAIKATESNKSTDQDKTVPALVAKDDTDGRILAYQVHMLRKNWGKAAETKSIKTIITDIKQNNSGITDKDLIKKLKEITAHTDAELSDLLKLIKYEDDIIEKVISGQIDMSYLIQIESSFINPLKREYPALLNKYGEDNLRKLLVHKAANGLLVNTRFLMDKFKYVFADDNKKAEIEKLIEQFFTNKDKNIQETFDEYLKLNPALNKKISPIKKLQKIKGKKGKQVGAGADNYKKIKLTKREESSLKSIRNNFESIGKTLTQEEFDYISEAINCFERDCYKAAVVMIWAAGISRVINYIAKGLSAFKTDCNSMVALNKPPYKYFKDAFTKIGKVVDSQEDLKDGIDMPLILFLLHKTNISMTEYKKLKADHDTRCDCAHPTDIKLSFHEVIKIFQDMYKLIFCNSKLK